MHRLTQRILFLLLALLVSAQLGIEEVRAQDDIVPAHQFLIRNRSRVEITFSLRKGLGPWHHYRLGPGEDNLYENNDQVWFSPSGQEPIHREVKLGQRYKFIFGARWDFVRIDPDQFGALGGGTPGEDSPSSWRRRLGGVSVPLESAAERSVPRSRSRGATA